MSLSLAEQTRRGPAGNCRVLTAGGCLDLHSAPVLRDRLIELLDSGQRCLVLDLEGVEFLDSTGLGVLVGGLKRVRSHVGSLHLVCQREKILKVFRITGLTKVFPIHDSVADAIAASNAADGAGAAS